MNERLIALVGLPGSGKSTVGRILTARGFGCVYFGAVTLEKLREVGRADNEANEREMREQLRAEHGMHVYAELNAPKIVVALEVGDTFIDGLYSWEEYTFLKEKFPVMETLAVYAPPALRYQRLAERPERPLSAAEASSRDYSQITNIHQAGPIAMADWTFSNIGSEAELVVSVENYLDGHP